MKGGGLSATTCLISLPCISNSGSKSCILPPTSRIVVTWTDRPTITVIQLLFVLGGKIRDLCCVWKDMKRWIWKGVSATFQSGRYTLSYPRGTVCVQNWTCIYSFIHSFDHNFVKLIPNICICKNNPMWSTWAWRVYILKAGGGGFNIGLVWPSWQ